MTGKQFDLITRLLRMTSKPILTAAKLVLIDGERQVDAARAAGCRPNNLSRDIEKIRAAHEDIQSAYK